MSKSLESVSESIFVIQEDRLLSRGRVQKIILIALEIIVGGAAVGGALYFAHLHGIGTIGLIGIGAGGALGILALALATGLFPRKKSSPQESPRASEVRQPEKGKHKKIIKGKICVRSVNAVGALGSNFTYMHDNTAKVGRVDGKDWKTFPNEMMIHCKIYESDKTKYNIESVYLPLCLFIENDNYSKLKTYNDLVSFKYDNFLYQLTLSQLKELPIPFNRVIEQCEKNYYQKSHGKTVFSRSESEEEVQYLSPITLQKNNDLVKKTEDMKDKFYREFSEEYEIPSLFFPTVPDYHLVKDGKNLIIRIELRATKEDEIDVFTSDTTFALYAPRHVPQFPGTKTIYHYKDVPYDPEEYLGLKTRQSGSEEHLFMLDFEGKFDKKVIVGAPIDIQAGRGYHLLTLILPADQLRIPFEQFQKELFPDS